MKTTAVCKITPPKIQESDDSTGEVIAYLSRGSEDRTGERLDPGGWELETFRQSGVITYNHASEFGVFERMPIAKWHAVWTDAEGLLAHYQYLLEAPGQLGEMAKTLYYLERERALPGHSVWFEPLAWEDADGTRGERGPGDPYPRMPLKGRVYQRQALIEGGPVLVPAHPDAVTLAVKALRKSSMSVPTWAQDDFSARVLAPIFALDGNLWQRVENPNLEEGWKAGRVISAANMVKLKTARGAMQAAVVACDEVIAAGESMMEEESDQSTGAGDAPLTAMLQRTLEAISPIVNCPGLGRRGG